MLDAADPIRIDRLVRSRRRSIGLEVTREGALVVRAPRGAGESEIRQVVEDKSGWIRKTIERLLRKAPERAQKRFAAGETFDYLGNKYVLSYDDRVSAGFLEFVEAGEGRGFRLAPDAFGASEVLDVPDAPGQARAAALFEDWYRWRAIRVFRESCDRYAARMGLEYGGLRITDARARWGSCGPGADIRLNWRLVMAPLEIIDYVVVHELAHIRRPDHSRAFWRVVESAMPEWRARRAWLRENDSALSWNIERKNG